MQPITILKKENEEVKKKRNDTASGLSEHIHPAAKSHSQAFSTLSPAPALPPHYTSS